MPCLRDRAARGRSRSRPLRRGAGDRLGLARDHALGRGRGPSARARAHRGSWQALTGYNSITVGVQRIAVDAGRWATPLHLEGSEEEIFYVLSGTGFSVPGRGRRRARVPGRPGRLPRPPCARACPHDRRRRRRARGARVRPAALRRQHAAAARRRVVARPDLGAAGRSGGPSRGRGKLPSVLRPGPSSPTVPRASQPRRRARRSSATAQPSATSRAISVGPSARSGRG